MTTPLVLVFMGGLLGSAHCVGMCGGFVVGIGLGSKSWGGNLARQLVYSLGRVCTYILIGAMSGFAGFWAGVWLCGGVGGFARQCHLIGLFAPCTPALFGQPVVHRLTSGHEANRA